MPCNHTHCVLFLLYPVLQGRWQLLASSFYVLRKLRPGVKQLCSDPETEGTDLGWGPWPDSRPSGTGWLKVETSYVPGGLEWPVFSVSEGIYLDLKHLCLPPFECQECPFQHFLGCILCFVEFPLEFLQLRYTVVLCRCPHALI